MNYLNIIKLSQNELCKTPILWISLLPFLFIRTSLGRLVFINGLLAHATGNKILVSWDVINNVIMGFYVSYTSLWQPYANLLIIMSTLVWQYNRNYNNNKIKFIIVHILGVQWSLLLVGYNY